MLNRIQIFLAEDNPGDVALVREALREYDVECSLTLASDGAEAKRYLAQMGKTPDAPCPQLLLLDLNLPMADGYELAEAFRAHPLSARIPIIIVTSSGAPKDRERAAALGVSRYFRKPSELAEFLKLGAIIRDLVAECGLAAQPA